MIYWSWNVEKYEKHARIEKCFSIFAKNACENIFVVFPSCLKMLQEIITENIAPAIA